MPYEKEIQILSELRSGYSCFDPNEREYYHTLSEAIRSLKTKRYGHWIEAKYPLFICSECGATYQDNGYGYNYCPNCGADMSESTMSQVKPSDKEFTLYADDKPIVTFKDSKIVLHGERKEDELLVTDKD